MRIRKELLPEDITILVDTREQRPFDLNPYRTKSTTLTTGDYTVFGLESLICLERKSLGDLVLCCGAERERFEREIKRLMGFEARAIIVEAEWTELYQRNWRSTLSVKQVTNSVTGWIAQGIPIICAGVHASEVAKEFLFLAARRRYRQLISLGINIIAEK
jgi:ERCC4-type nuclease